MGLKRTTLFLLVILVTAALYSMVSVAQEDAETATQAQREEPGKLNVERLIAECRNVASEVRYGLVEGGGYDRVVGPTVIVVRIEGTIGVAMRDYLLDAIRYAEERNSPLIVELNTPGGLLDPTFDMVVAISEARVPVIGYVVDKWAESAGTILLMSTHVAAMEPGTIIGSVQPVIYDPASGSYRPQLEPKIINPIVKMLCEHGATRGRNPEALVRFVIYNDNYTAREALEKGVIDLIAESREDLIAQLNGKIVALPSGGRVKLELNGSIEEYSPSIRIRLLHIISDPIVSGLLLSLGALALLFSIASGNFPGIAVGGFLLLLGLLGSGFNPNIIALLLLLGGAVLVFIELYTPGFGLVGGTGILMLVLGLALMPIRGEGLAVSEEYADTLVLLVYAIGLSIGGFTAFSVYKVVKARRAPPKLWKLEGAEGVALDDIPKGGEGFIILEGEYWKVVAVDDVKKGDKVVVIGKEGPLLKVKKKVEE
ncbi:MAG: nodulation protein NfeD [Desulfurococcales archaeon]|nr:nodulation protein NfeD [Desulfurococcales archaeon]